jgi:hypothetical protein
MRSFDPRRGPALPIRGHNGMGAAVTWSSRRRDEMVRDVGDRRPARRLRDAAAAARYCPPRASAGASASGEAGRDGAGQARCADAGARGTRIERAVGGLPSHAQSDAARHMRRLALAGLGLALAGCVAQPYSYTPPGVYGAPYPYNSVPPTRYQPLPLLGSPTPDQQQTGPIPRPRPRPPSRPRRPRPWCRPRLRPPGPAAMCPWKVSGPCAGRPGQRPEPHRSRECAPSPGY